MEGAQVLHSDLLKFKCCITLGVRFDLSESAFSSIWQGIKTSLRETHTMPCTYLHNYNRYGYGCRYYSPYHLAYNIGVLEVCSSPHQVSWIMGLSQYFLTFSHSDWLVVSYLHGSVVLTSEFPQENSYPWQNVPFGPSRCLALEEWRGTRLLGLTGTQGGGRKQISYCDMW